MEETVDSEVHEAEVHDGDESDDEAVTSKPRRYKSPTVLVVDLKGGTPLRSFLETLPLDSDSKRYMAIAYWFKTYRSTAEVTPDHIYTGYKAMNWTTIPKDVGGPLRSLKKDGFFAKGSGKHAYTINHIGESKVEEMINKATPPK